MSGPPTEGPAAAADPAPAPRVVVRRARYRDIGRLVRLYRNRSAASIHGYHPFPFDRFRLTLIYFSLISGQWMLHWAMRRFPRAVAILLIAQVEGRPQLAGSGTLRGVARSGEEPRVRFGFVVADGVQGLGIGKRLLWALAKAGLDLGYAHGVGVVFRSDSKAISAISRAGFRFMPTDYRDPLAPDEPNFATEGDLAEMVRLAQDYTPSARPGQARLSGYGGGPGDGTGLGTSAQ